MLQKLIKENTCYTDYGKDNMAMRKSRRARKRAKRHARHYQRIRLAVCDPTSVYYEGDWLSYRSRRCYVKLLEIITNEELRNIKKRIKHKVSRRRSWRSCKSFIGRADDALKGLDEVAAAIRAQTKRDKEPVRGMLKDAAILDDASIFGSTQEE